MGLSILVVDDQAATRELYRHHLQQAGHQVELAEEGIHAEYQFKSAKYDAVICDIFMPRQEGLLTIKHMKAQSPDCFFIAVSGGTSIFDGPDFLEQAKLMGADEAMEKPVDIKQLLELLASREAT